MRVHAHLVERPLPLGNHHGRKAIANLIGQGPSFRHETATSASCDVTLTMLPPAPSRLLPQMEHAGQVDCDHPLAFCGIDVEKGGGLTDADTIEEHIQSAEIADRSRNRGVDGRPVAHVGSNGNLALVRNG
jgi:hypothetical protein